MYRILFLLFIAILTIGSNTLAQEKFSRMHDIVAEEIKCSPLSEYSEKLEKKALNGNVLAQFELAECYYYGWGVSKDKRKARTLFESVMGAKDKYRILKASSQFHLYIYPESKEETTDLRWYIRRLENASCFGDDRAEYLLGICYLIGDCGINKFIPEAEFWLRKSAEQGNSDAQLMLGSIYSNKDNSEYNPHEALKYLEQAVKNGHNRAALELGVIYYKDSTVKDTSKALYWLEKSQQLFEKNDESPLKFHPYKPIYSITQLERLSKALLGEIYYKGDGIEKDYTKAFHYLNESAHGIFESQTFPDTLKLLSNCYRFGRGVEQDIEMANELLKEAAQCGNEDSLNLLLNLMGVHL